MTRPMTIFSVYVQTDEALWQQLEQHLLLLQRQGVIALLPSLPAEVPWGEKTRQLFQEAELILLLISPSFQTSEECKERMQHALERQKRGEVQVFPIMLRSGGWKDAPFSHLHVLPSNGRAVMAWGSRDAAFHSIVLEFYKLIPR